MTIIENKRYEDEPDPKLEGWRSEIRQYRLLPRLRGICESINQSAGAEIVRHQEFRGPQGTLFKCTLEENSLTYEMELALRKSGLEVEFWFRGMPSGNHPQQPGDLHLQARPEELADTRLMHQLNVDPQDLENSDMKLWFVYLLSGFRQSLAPTTRTLQAPRKAA